MGVLTVELRLTLYKVILDLVLYAFLSPTKINNNNNKKTVLNPLLMHHRTHAKASVKMPSHFFLASVTTV